MNFLLKQHFCCQLVICVNFIIYCKKKHYWNQILGSECTEFSKLSLIFRLNWAKLSEKLVNYHPWNREAPQNGILKYDWWSLCKIPPSDARNLQQLYWVKKIFKRPFVRRKPENMKVAIQRQLPLVQGCHFFVDWRISTFLLLLWAANLLISLFLSEIMFFSPSYWSVIKCYIEV